MCILTICKKIASKLSLIKEAVTISSFLRIMLQKNMISYALPCTSKVYKHGEIGNHPSEEPRATKLKTCPTQYK